MRIAYRSTVALILSALFVISTGTGCVLSQSTSGTTIQQEQVEAVIVGGSTRQDVAKVLGAPDEIIYSNLEHDALFERAYQYSRRRRKTTFFTFILFSGSRADINHDEVIVFFDRFGLVEDVSFRLDMDRPRYGAPWGDDDS